MRAYIFTEGGPEFGYGHISRCSALYDALVDEMGISCTMLIAGDAKVADNIEYRHQKWYDPESLKDLDFSDALVIADSYHAPAEFYAFIAARAKTALFLDDTMRIDYPAPSYVLNPALSAEKMSYPKKDGLRYLLGIEYALIRTAFNRKVPQTAVQDQSGTRQPPQDEAKPGKLPQCTSRNHILIAMGGGDTANITRPVLHSVCMRLPSSPVIVIVGKGYRDPAGLEQENRSSAAGSVEIVHDASAEQMRDIMQKSAVAFSAGGQTLYELLRMRTPTIAFQIAENQSGSLEAFRKFGIIGRIYTPSEADLAVRDYCTSAPAIPPPILDGQGASRVICKVTQNHNHS